VTGRVLLPLVGEGGPAKRGRMRVATTWRGATLSKSRAKRNPRDLNFPGRQRGMAHVSR